MRTKSTLAGPTRTNRPAPGENNPDSSRITATRITGLLRKALPIPQQFSKRCGLVAGRQLAGLVYRIYAMARGADADLAGLEGDPDPLSDDRVARRVSGLPSQCATGRHKGRRRAVSRDLHTADGPTGIGRILDLGVMHNLCNRASTRFAVAPDLVGLEDLKVGNIVDLAAFG